MIARMRTGSYVNGKWYHPSSGQVTRNINPADTADVIAEFPLAGTADASATASMAALPSTRSVRNIALLLSHFKITICFLKLK